MQQLHRSIVQHIVLSFTALLRNDVHSGFDESISDKRTDRRIPGSDAKERRAMEPGFFLVGNLKTNLKTRVTSTLKRVSPLQNTEEPFRFGEGENKRGSYFFVRTGSVGLEIHTHAHQTLITHSSHNILEVKRRATVS